MAMRLSGLISGMDTETVVRQLMEAHRLKNTKLENKITTTEWKQDKWAALNTKLYSFYTGSLSKIRMQGSFAVKKASSSNESKLEVSAGANAPEGTHQIKVKQLASSQFVTGAKLGTDKNGNKIAMNTKLVDLRLDEDSEIKFDATNGTTIHIEAPGKKGVNLDIRENTTVGDLVNSLKSAGLNANFDAGQNRLFISSKSSGVKSAFSITTSSTNLVKEKNKIKDFIGYDSLNTTDKNKVEGYLNQYLDGTLADADRKVIEDKILEVKHQQVRTSYVKDYITDKDNRDRVTQEVEAELRMKHKLEEDENLDPKLLKAAIDDKLAQEAEMIAFEELDIYQRWAKGEEGIEIKADNIFKVAAEDLSPLMASYKTAMENPGTIEQSGSLSLLGIGEITNVDGTVAMNERPEGSVLVKATDAKIIYNEAELTGSSNNFTVNGLTLNLKGVTAEDEVISISVSNNTEAVYDMVKDFVNEYNELLKEMNTAYNAKSARGYDPPSDDDRQAMTDAQIEKVEGVIKDSLLRRDNTLAGLLNVMRSTLSEGVKVNGKAYSLASFGITSPDYTERGILHISGDADSAKVGALDNKLMEALTNNPDDVMAVLTKLGENLYGSLMDKMKSNTLSSALTVYNDKEISKTLSNYKSDLAKLETKLLDIENRYFKQFAAMETAMARMNSQSSALMSMLGTNNMKQ